MTYTLIRETDDDYQEHELEVEYTFIKGEPEVRYYTNGDGHPGSQDEIELDEATMADGSEIPFELTEKEWDAIRDACMEDFMEGSWV
jgi:hypothetical protein